MSLKNLHNDSGEHRQRVRIGPSPQAFSAFKMPFTSRRCYLNFSSEALVSLMFVSLFVLNFSFNFDDFSVSGYC